MKKLDFNFGEPYILNENLKRFCRPIFKWDYTSYGPRVLAESTRDIALEMIEKITGVKYKNLVITNGAQDGINLLLDRHKGDYLYTEEDLDLPYYSFHKMMARKHNNHIISKKEILLKAVPNNPTGNTADLDYSKTIFYTQHKPLVIWDAAYFSNNYIKGDLKVLVPQHDYMVGSFGKTFGIPGIRLGWIASNESLDIIEATQRLNQLRPNYMSIGVILQILNNMAQDDWSNLDFFFKLNYNRIQENKDLFQEVIEKYDLQLMPINGMFYWGGNAKFKADLDKCGVLYVDGVDCGGRNGELRLNMAVSKEIMQELVSVLLKM